MCFVRFRTLVAALVAAGTFLVLAAPAAAQGGASEDAGVEARNRAIRAALRGEAAVDFQETPLEDVVKSLGQIHHIRIALDERALDDLGVGVDTPVTRTVKKATLRSVLRLILSDLDLTYVVAGGNLVITTRDEADSRLEIKVYGVKDLIGDGGPLGKLQDSPYFVPPLIDVLTATVAADSWDKYGGPGSMLAFRGTLVVTQTQEVHEQVAALLAVLRQTRKQLKAGGPARFRPVKAQATPRGEALAAALRVNRAHLNFKDTALADVVRFLREKHGLEFQIDHRALDDLGIGTDTPITVIDDDAPLGLALERLLRNLDLTCVVQDDIAMITTQDVADTQLQPIVYPVGDLVEDDEGLGEPDFESLIDTIKTAVFVDSWDDAGGPGSVAEFDDPRCLVIDQTQEVHAAIQKLLTALRAALREQAAQPEGAGEADALEDGSEVPQTTGQGPPGQGDQADQPTRRAGKLSLKAYWLMSLTGGPIPSPAQVAQLIRDVVEPDSWKSEGAALEPLPGALVVRNTAGAQAEIGRLLEALGVYQEPALSSGMLCPSSLIPIVGGRPGGGSDATGGDGILRQFDSGVSFDATQPLVNDTWRTVWKRRRGDEQQYLIVYRLTPRFENDPPQPTGPQLEGVIRKLIAPGDWTDGGHFIRGLPGVLVVEHNSDVQKEIARLLEGAGVWQQTPQAGVGGGAGGDGAARRGAKGGGFFCVPSRRPC